ncbi:uncharacterized protein LOC131433832 [Malaya genurostris]|uniref:uncharacterized protein LOC131433832 n=1 Tax=Malaya genurostris TaxID=325434 RepID=UPI0026F3AA8D|nr:uncharacterized protein LOC131433832 [Malaya genurostris]
MPGGAAMSTRILVDLLKNRGFGIVALQEVCWTGSMVRTFRDDHTIYQSCGNTCELRTAFIVMGDMQRRVIGWWPIDERMCRLRIKGRFFNFSIINVHSPHSGSTDDDKDTFYAQLERYYDCCPSHDVKIIIKDLNAQVGQEEELRPTIGRSPQQTESQIDHVLTDGRHFSDVIDVRTYRGANVDSDHYLVMVKLRQELSIINNARYQLPQRYNIERLKQPDVASAYAQNLEAALPDEGELDVAPLEDCWSTVKAAINNAAECTVGTVSGTESTERMVRRKVQGDFGGEERSAGGNAAAWNPAERGTIQTEAKRADPHLSGEKTPPGRRGVRGNGTAVPLSRNTEILQEAQQIPQWLCVASRNVQG